MMMFPKVATLGAWMSVHGCGLSTRAFALLENTSELSTYVTMDVNCKTLYFPTHDMLVLWAQS